MVAKTGLEVSRISILSHEELCFCEKSTNKHHFSQLNIHDGPVHTDYYFSVDGLTSVPLSQKLSISDSISSPV